MDTRESVAGYRGRVAFPLATLEITLTGTDVTRTVTVPHDVPLAGLHAVVQAAMGWQDSHLHMFRTSRDTTVWTNWVQEPARERDENEGTLRELAPVVGSALEYVYDYGDDWSHRIEVTALGEGTERAATLVDAHRACPPEDFGGPDVFAEFVRYLRTGEGDLPIAPQDYLAHFFDGVSPEGALQQLEQPETEVLRARVARVPVDVPGPTTLDHWPEEFHDGLPLAHLARRWNSPTLAHLLVRAFAPAPEFTEETALEATALVRWYLDFVGDGLPLTKAGYLKPADSTRVVEHIRETEPDRFIYISDTRKTATFRESDTYEVLFLREFLTAAGLLRRYKGRLVPVASRAKLRDRPVELARHLASLFVPEEPYDEDDITVVALVNLLLDDPAITGWTAVDAARAHRLDPVFGPILRLPGDLYPRTPGEFADSLRYSLTGELERLGLMDRGSAHRTLSAGGRALVAEIARQHPDRGPS